MESNNQGYVIQKGAFALIMVVIALVSCVGTVIAYTVTIRTDVDYLKDECQIVTTRHTNMVDELRANIVQNQNAIIKNQERIIAMQDDIKEIKTDVKELI